MPLYLCRLPNNAYIRPSLIIATDTMSNHKKKYFTFFLLIFIYSCKTVRNISQRGTTKNVHSVLIIGNSIVKHPSAPNIGWAGDWGMAASIADSDFVHLLTKKIHDKDKHVIVNAINLADFERNYATYSIKNLDSLKNPDIVIIKLSENIDDNNIIGNNFISYYDCLVKYIAPSKKTITIIADGFWPKSKVNTLIEQYAVRNKFSFVKIDDLSSDITNTGAGKFKDPGVAKHPSDKGMRLIANRIWLSIHKYF